MNEILEKFLNKNCYSKNILENVDYESKYILEKFTAENPIVIWHKIESEKDCPDNDRDVILRCLNYTAMAFYGSTGWEAEDGSIYTNVIAWTEVPVYKGE